MSNMLLVLLVIGVAVAAPTKSFCFSQNITLSPQKPQFKIPLTQLLPSQRCAYSFAVPSNYFAVVSVLAKDMIPEEVTKRGPYYDYIGVQDLSYGAIGDGRYDTAFNSTEPWPTNFGILVVTHNHTQMQYQINVQLQKSQFGQNLVKTYTTETNGDAIVLYPNEMHEGETYTFTSKSGTVGFATAVAKPKLANQLNSIFIYDGGNLLTNMDTLRDDTDSSTHTDTNTLQLYAAQKPGPTDGAILITDQSNIESVFTFGVAYVPTDGARGQVHTLGIGTLTLHTTCVSIMGPRDVAYDIVDASGPGIWIYPGGPGQLNPSVTDLLNTTLPLRVTGNLNTLCVSIYSGEIKYVLV